MSLQDAVARLWPAYEFTDEMAASFGATLKRRGVGLIELDRILAEHRAAEPDAKAPNWKAVFAAARRRTDGAGELPPFEPRHDGADGARLLLRTAYRESESELIREVLDSRLSADALREWAAALFDAGWSWAYHKHDRQDRDQTKWLPKLREKHEALTPAGNLTKAWKANVLADIQRAEWNAKEKESDDETG